MPFPPAQHLAREEPPFYTKPMHDSNLMTGAAPLLQCAHVMAMAVQRLFPEARTTIGPCIENGFYYDFDMAEPITEADLKRVKAEMVKIIKADLPLVCQEVCAAPCIRSVSVHGVQLMAPSSVFPASEPCVWCDLGERGAGAGKDECRAI